MAITNGYCTLAELKASVGIPPADTADDTLLEIAIESASRQIDAYTSRRFWQDPSVVTRYYTATDDTALDVDGIATTTGLVVKTDDNGDGTFETTWTINTDFRLEPMNAAADGQPWTRIVAIGSKLLPTSWSRGVEVTARGGFTAVPTAIKQACLLQAARLFKRKDAPFGVVGSVEIGGETRIDGAVLDGNARDLLNPYRRPWVFV